MSIRTDYVAGEVLPAADVNEVNAAVLALQYEHFGTGVDGALSVPSGTVSIDCNNQSLVVKNYTTVNIAAGATLNFINVPAAGVLFIMRTQGNCTIAGKIDLKGAGSQGGAGVTSTGTLPTSGSTSGNNGTTPYNHNNQTTRNGKSGSGSGGIGATTATGGSGGANAFNGASSVSGGGAATSGLTDQLFKILAAFGIVVGPGAGGGSGGAAFATDAAIGTLSASSGDAGDGGGGLLVLCGGTLAFTGEIDLSGTDAAAGTHTYSPNGSPPPAWSWAAVARGGSGGGASGIGLLLARELGTLTGTKTVNGGLKSSGAAAKGGTGTATGSDGTDGAAGVIEIGVTA